MGKKRMREYGSVSIPKIHLSPSSEWVARVELNANGEDLAATLRQ
jgi:hypothetical protein